MLLGNKLSSNENLNVTLGTVWDHKRIHTFTADISLPVEVFKNSSRLIFLTKCFSPTDSVSATETTFYFPVYLYFILFLS